MSIETFPVAPEAHMESQGRNGYAATHGIEIMVRDFNGMAKEVLLTPITSKGQPQSCVIGITPEAMDQLADWWKALRQKEQANAT